VGKIVNQTELAEIFGVSDVTIWDWQGKGLPILKQGARGEANQYDTTAVIEWRIQAARAESGKSESQRDREVRLRGDMLEIEIAKERKVLVSTSDVEPTWTGRVMAAAAYQLSRHSRLATVLEVTPGVEGKRAVLKKEDQEFLERLGVDGAEMHRQVQELLDKLSKADADDFLRRIANIGQHPVESPAGGVAAADPAAQNTAV
jgi:phage terminase Nu1 subunit (DNA packaging protein)